MPHKPITQLPADIRRALWHLRDGGVPQLREHLRREKAATRSSGTPALPAGTTSAPSRPTHKPQRRGLAIETTRHGRLHLDFPELNPVERAPRHAGVRVGVILDDFSLAAWGNEFTIVELTPTDWPNQVTDLDLIFIESAWNGNHGAWQYQLTGNNAPSPALREMIAHCRAQNIPTVFWNKEDPPHFHDFLATAALFDTVFTSDSNKIPDYREELGHENVFPLAFAAQDAIHNPIRPQHGYHDRDIAFAGMYFAHKFPERREQMEFLLGAAEAVSPKMERGLEIFSRFLGDDARYQFPGTLGDRVVGSLSYNKMLTAYKAFKVFLNVNSVVDSPSMCARRVFEITASGTPVVTTRSAAIPNYFTGDEVPVVDTPEEAQGVLRGLVRSPELNSRTVHLAQRKIWEGHTYTHRAEQVLTAAGVPFTSQTALPSVSALVSTNRPHQLENVLQTVAGFKGVDVELNLLTHGFEASDAELRAQAAELGLENLNLLNASADVPLGECLNRLVGAASGAVLTKIDDDDLYGPDYLRDLLFARRFSGADVVGKQAHYMHLEGMGLTLLRSPEREHRWTSFIMGPTITGSREVFEAHPFGSLGRGEDTDFLRRVTASGGSIYSADRFNFMQLRSAAGAHTWDAGDRELLGTGVVAFYGRGEENVLV
ncbi:glycosyltransferase [Rothia sp. LK2588]|uniref:glycosyltransferase family protein n=1 Tax=Rothia sp. LK2588 TaxID=3114369 RepID=UPI0034CF5668